jgi:SAM-dependent methyltransferase
MANEAQRENWNGESGRNWVERQDQFDASNATWADLLLETAAPAPGERVLDVGCGCGATTLAAARATGPGGQAVGADLSAPMLGVARARAERAGLANARFAVADAQTDDLAALDGGGPYDLAISRFGVMFFDGPVAAFANIGRAVRPGGRLAMTVWAAGDQEWLKVPLGAAAPVLGVTPGDDAAPPMQSLGDADHVTGLLQRAGWGDVATALHDRPMVVGGARTVEDAASFLAGTGPGRALFADAEPSRAGAAMAAIRDVLAPRLTPEGVILRGAVLAVTARRVE